MKNKPYILSLLIALGLLVGCGAQADNQQKQSSRETSTAPNFRLKSFRGKWVQLSDLRGKVVILDFWTTWCPPCRKEIPHFVELYREYKGRGLMILGVSLDRNGMKVLPGFVSKYRVNYPILLTDGKIDRAYGGVRAIPTTFIIDRKGRIRQKFVGMRSKSTFEGEIKKLLVEK